MPGPPGFDGEIETSLSLVIFPFCIFSVWIKSAEVGITGNHPELLPLRAILLARDFI